MDDTSNDRYPQPVRFLPPRWLWITMGSIILVLAALISASTVAVRDSFPRTTGELILSLIHI